ncbi:Peroxyureidoacrylate/ureidoacrylate amidohydrolase RutB [Colletotrichum siamense]|uniref:Peroxyureidoacrylate/ureidoacrylate amidohydrolase RutB n=1 Tax=Colletotrichum siamense TaxID=690259 RepID=A0A9P5K5D1_COLSI|nr:Peroxyureidoacrylate/ureidoacrylate amidohydrolase RutB [Colletotrichum siamense]KAF4859612.1 Peroxyureidoacrylate/ureidoacrylate amidohydrolase RutB [Colletotrichum siamense]
MVLGGPSETFPWTLSRKTFETKELKFCHGSCPFFGGRSTFWSAWSPRPTLDLMRDFPETMKKTAEQEEFWKKAKELLNVTSADQIDDGVFGSLQTAIDSILKDSVGKIPTADYVESAPLAVGKRSPTSRLRFNKFSVPGPLLGILEQQRQLAKANMGAPLEIVVDCAVKSMAKGDDDNFVRVVETSKGTLSWTGNKTRIILCAGAIPNATMLLNSFESCRDTVGKRLTGHYVTHISARCPVKNVKGWKKEDTLKIAAAYLAGKDPKTGLQYHVSVTALNSPNPKDDAEDAARECPDYAAAATLDQLTGSEDYVVFVCSALGEFNEKNTKNHVTLNKGTDPTCNVTLQYTLSDEDYASWDVMDTATYDTIKEMSGGDEHESSIEWWDEKTHGWIKAKPAVDTIRIPDLQEKGTVENIRSAVAAARSKAIPIYYGLHQQYTEHSFHGWKHMTPNNVKQSRLKFFAEGSWGAEILQGLEPDVTKGDVVASRHWNSDSFENTDLDFQLRQREITHLVFAGLTANTCLEASARHAFELGYHVTLLKDATAGWSKELTDAATALIWPLFAQEVLNTEEWVQKQAVKSVI